MNMYIAKTGKNNVFTIGGKNGTKNAALISFRDTYGKQLAVIQNCIVDLHFHNSPTSRKAENAQRHYLSCEGNFKVLFRSKLR